MSINISDEIVQASHLSEAELRQEIAILLFQQGKLTLGHASKLAEIDKPQFQQLLSDRHIPLYSYDVEDYEQELKNLRDLGDL
jgi:predicted HTH domain antitoxin